MDHADLPQPVGYGSLRVDSLPDGLPSRSCGPLRRDKDQTERSIGSDQLVPGMGQPEDVALSGHVGSSRESVHLPGYRQRDPHPAGNIRRFPMAPIQLHFPRHEGSSLSWRLHVGRPMGGQELPETGSHPKIGQGSPMVCSRGSELPDGPESPGLHRLAVRHLRRGNEKKKSATKVPFVFRPCCLGLLGRTQQ